MLIKMTDEDYMMSEMIEQIQISDFYSKYMLINNEHLIDNLKSHDLDKIIFKSKYEIGNMNFLWD